ncbi:23S rRNA (guanosine(2251)-2'-O)-methyltransferase RlmB [Spirochaeta dissipatitropha]
MLLFNFQAISEALKAGRKGVLFIRKGKNSPRVQTLSEKAKSSGIQVKFVSDRELQSIAGDRQRGIAFQLMDSGAVDAAPDKNRDSSKDKSRDKSRMPVAHVPGDFGDRIKALGNAESALILFLDGITDPHNLGAILRSADIFSVDAVVIPGRRSAGITSSVIEVSSGAAHYVPVFQVSNLNRALEESKEQGFWIYGADMGGEKASALNLGGKVGLVLGSEGKGLHQHTASLCDHIISIPMKGHVDSLNVSVAAGVLMYEVRRQQGW